MGEGMSYTHDDVRRAAELDRLHARVSELEEALSPFAKAAPLMTVKHARKYNAAIWSSHDGEVQILVADLDRAARTLKDTDT